MSRRTYMDGTRPKTLYIIRYRKNHIEVDEPIRMERPRLIYIIRYGKTHMSRRTYTEEKAEDPIYNKVEEKPHRSR